MISNQNYRGLIASPLSLAANLLLVDPGGLGGMHCKARVSPWRTAFLQQYLSRAESIGPVVALASHADERSLIGGVDWAASLRQGLACFEAGVLGRVNKGVLKVGMADRLNLTMAGLIAQAMDQGALPPTLARDDAGCASGSDLSFACLLLDEALDEENAAPGLLCCRLAFWISEDNLLNQPLSMLRSADLLRARGFLRRCRVPGFAYTALSEAALAFGVDDLRAAQFALRAFRALLALARALDPQAREALDHEEALGAVAALVFGPRATRLPNSAEAALHQDQGSKGELPPAHTGVDQRQAARDDQHQGRLRPDEARKREALAPELDGEQLQAATRSPAQTATRSATNSATNSAEASDDQPAISSQDESAQDGPRGVEQVLALAVAAAQALLPPGLLASGALAAAALSGSVSSGRSTTRSKAGLRGRSLGVREGLPGPRTRLHVLATIRAAVPWQGLRERSSKDALMRIERSDLRIHRYEQRDQLTTVFVVDASGSAALHRLAEVKGAVELLLAQCYVRRDQVAVIAFRLDQAQLLLPATRSLTRAKRQLAALPGGGGTPLASALALTTKLMLQWRRQGQRIQAIVLSDGKANIDLEGKPGRRKAMLDAQHQARLLARLTHRASRLVWVDTAPRPSSDAQSMAQLMGASYMLLPYANAQGLAALAS